MPRGFSAPHAITFEGLSGYLHTRLCIEALRRSRCTDTQADLVPALGGWGRRPLGGLNLAFPPERQHESQFVELGAQPRRHGPPVKQQAPARKPP